MRKKILSLFLSLTLVAGGMFFTNVKAEQKEMRAAWISTVANIDWPSKASYNNPARQKQEFISLIDKLKQAGMNTVVVQVRPEADALYKSDINPWSRFLTGTQGKNPGYDPLKFMIDESHKRGLEFHAWFNPYRACFYRNFDTLAADNMAKLHKDWVINYNGKWYFDPGRPEVRNYIVNSIGEVVENYDVDAIHFDDYFYPGPAFPDDASYAKYGNGMNRGDWRRENVNKLLKNVNTRIKRIKPYVEFGVSPGGIWRNKSSISNGSNTAGNETYANAHADTRTWIQRGLVDYVVPQVYWKMGHPKADYRELVRWWSNEVKGTNVKLYIGQGVYKKGQKEYAGENVAREIASQIALNRKYPEIKGSMYFSAKDVAYNQQVFNDVKRMNSTPASTPTTKPGQKPSEPVKPTETTDVNAKAIYGKDRYDTAARISKEGWKNGSDTAVIVNGTEIYDSVLASTLASAYDAPLLLTKNEKVTDYTSNELKRLNPSKVIIAGKTSTIGNGMENSIKSILPNASTEVIKADSISDLSLEIAKKIQTVNNINTVYVSGSMADVDVLSISSKAGEEKQVILVSDRDRMSPEMLDWVKSVKPSRSYYIGGTSMISDTVAKQVSDIVGNDPSRNRVYGKDRYETNAKVIQCFYTDGNYENLYFTKGRPIIDAVAAGPFAKNTKSPIVIIGNYLRNHQPEALSSIKADNIIKIGGEIPDSTFRDAVNRLKK